MKGTSIVFAAHDTIRLQEIELDPATLAPDEAIVRNLYSIVSAGTELACLKDQEPAWFRFPQSPGYIAVGEVAATGAAVTGVRVGQRVRYGGQHQAYNRRKAAELAPLDDDVDPKTALLASMASIAFQGLRASDIELGDHVGVIGLGVVGNLAAQLARLQGAYVIAMDLSDFRVGKAVACGLDGAVVASPAGNRPAVDAFTGGAGLHCLIEASGSPRPLMGNLDLLRRGGEVVLLGSPRDPLETNVTELLQCIHLGRRGGLRLKGACDVRPSTPRTFAAEPGRDWKLALRLIGEGRLNVAPLLTHVARPQEAEAVYRGLQRRGEEYLGVIFDWT